MTHGISMLMQQECTALEFAEYDSFIGYHGPGIQLQKERTGLDLSFVSQGMEL